MREATKTHLRVIEKDGPEAEAAAATTALEAIENAENPLEAFLRLQAWLSGPKAMSAQAHSVEEDLLVGGFEVLRQLLQQYIDSRGIGDVGKAVIKEVGPGRSVRMADKRERGCDYTSVFGTVRVTRVGYGALGERGVHPLDEQLNLPKRKYSHVLQKRGARAVARGPYEEAVQTIDETTAAHVPKRQLEEIAEESACDFDDFYENRSTQARPPEESGPILVGGVDCKGVPRRRTEEEKAEARNPRPGQGEEKRKKKMATVASVHTQQPYVRTAQEVVARLMDLDPPKPSRARPRPEDRRLWASVTKSKDDVINDMAAEMDRRDPEREKVVVCLTDGERALQKRAIAHIRRLFPAMFLILDIIHALEYLWKASHAFHPAGGEEARLWVRQRLLRILHGEVSSVAAGIRQSATKNKLTGKKRKAVDKACNYFLCNKDRMRYDEYLARGLPIASGNVEGACGHLVKDRMERTGAIWWPEGAEPVLKLRAVEKSGDFDNYWQYHLEQERRRNYPARWLAVVK